MLYFISDPIYTTHKTGPWHPEQPARTSVIVQALEKAGLKTAKNTLSPRFALENEVLLCHTQPYFRLVQQEVKALENPEEIADLSTGDVVISAHSFDAALKAAGGVIIAVDKVMEAPQTRAFCIIRPPGHHACSFRGMGFCLFNNAAIGARYAQKKYGIEKVLIADWDVHHGNGTQEIFYRDPTVYYFSTHEKGLYPNTGYENEIGEGPGLGFTLNCPIKPGIHSREEVLNVFDSLLREKMKLFQPELVIISAGFDAHEADPLGHFNLRNEDFGLLTKIINEIADEYAQGKVVSVLEGGYNLEALATAAAFHASYLDPDFS